MSSESVRVVKQGVLIKQAAFRKQWKKKYFVLTNTRLLWFPSRAAAFPRGPDAPVASGGKQVDLSGAQCVPYPTAKYEVENCFGVTPSRGGDRRLVLRAGSDEEMKSWVKAIQQRALAASGLVDQSAAKNPDNCSNATCTSTFKVRAKHRCFNCNLQFCRKCCSRTAKLSFGDPEPVCDDCYRLVTGKQVDPVDDESLLEPEDATAEQLAKAALAKWEDDFRASDTYHIVSSFAGLDLVLELRTSSASASSKSGPRPPLPSGHRTRPTPSLVLAKRSKSPNQRWWMDRRTGYLRPVSAPKLGIQMFSPGTKGRRLRRKADMTGLDLWSFEPLDPADLAGDGFVYRATDHKLLTVEPLCCGEPDCERSRIKAGSSVGWAAPANAPRSRKPSPVLKGQTAPPSAKASPFVLNDSAIALTPIQVGPNTPLRPQQKEALAHTTQRWRLQTDFEGYLSTLVQPVLDLVEEKRQVDATNALRGEVCAGGRRGSGSEYGDDGDENDVDDDAGDLDFRTGIDYGPFEGKWSRLWAKEASKGRAAISVWRPQLEQGQVMFGDIAVAGRLTSPTAEDLVAVYRDHSALRAPLGYELVWAHHPGKKGFHAWRPIAPDGYVALGHVGTMTPQKPAMDLPIRCVDVRFVTDLGRGFGDDDKVWEDLTRKDNPGTLWRLPRPTQTMVFSKFVRGPRGTVKRIATDSELQAADVAKLHAMSEPVQLVKPSSVDHVWCSFAAKTASKKQQLGPAVSVWRPKLPDGCVFFGDCVHKGFDPPSAPIAMAKDHPGLRLPSSYELVWHMPEDNKADMPAVWVWRPIPGMPDYEALGCVCTETAAPPALDLVRVVHVGLLMKQTGPSRMSQTWMAPMRGGPVFWTVRGLNTLEAACGPHAMPLNEADSATSGSGRDVGFCYRFPLSDAETRARAKELEQSVAGMLFGSMDKLRRMLLDEDSQDEDSEEEQAGASASINKTSKLDRFSHMRELPGALSLQYGELDRMVSAISAMFKFVDSEQAKAAKEAEDESSSSSSSSSSSNSISNIFSSQEFRDRMAGARMQFAQSKLMLKRLIFRDLQKQASAEGEAGGPDALEAAVALFSKIWGLLANLGNVQEDEVMMWGEDAVALCEETVPAVDVFVANVDKLVIAQRFRSMLPALGAKNSDRIEGADNNGHSSAPAPPKRRQASDQSLETTESYLAGSTGGSAPMSLTITLPPTVDEDVEDLEDLEQAVSSLSVSGSHGYASVNRSRRGSMAVATISPSWNGAIPSSDEVGIVLQGMAGLIGDLESIQHDAEADLLTRLARCYHARFMAILGLSEEDRTGVKASTRDSSSSSSNFFEAPDLACPLPAPLPLSALSDHDLLSLIVWIQEYEAAMESLAEHSLLKEVVIDLERLVHVVMDCYDKASKASTLHWADTLLRNEERAHPADDEATGKPRTGGPAALFRRFQQLVEQGAISRGIRDKALCRIALTYSHVLTYYQEGLLAFLEQADKGPVPVQNEEMAKAQDSAPVLAPVLVRDMLKSMDYFCAQVNNTLFYEQYLQGFQEQVAEHVADVQLSDRVGDMYEECADKFLDIALFCTSVLASAVTRALAPRLSAVFSQTWVDSSMPTRAIIQGMRSLHDETAGRISREAAVGSLVKRSLHELVACYVLAAIKNVPTLGPHLRFGGMDQDKLFQAIRRDAKQWAEYFARYEKQLPQRAVQQALDNLLLLEDIMTAAPDRLAVPVGKFMTSFKSDAILDASVCVEQLLSWRGDLTEEQRGAALSGVRRHAASTAQPVPSRAGVWDVEVTVESGQGLAPKDANMLSDPYCVVSLLSAGAHEVLASRKTKVITKCLNPVWAQTFSDFDSDVAGRFKYLSAEVWDRDRMSADDFMGKAVLSVSEIRKYQVIKISSSPKPASNTRSLKQVSAAQVADQEAARRKELHTVTLELPLQPQPAELGGAKKKRKRRVFHGPEDPPLHREDEVTGSVKITVCLLEREAKELPAVKVGPVQSGGNSNSLAPIPEVFAPHKGRAKKRIGVFDRILGRQRNKKKMETLKVAETHAGGALPPSPMRRMPAPAPSRDAPRRERRMSSLMKEQARTSSGGSGEAQPQRQPKGEECIIC